MYHSFSNLLRETQSAAAKKLGILENALADSYPDADAWTDDCPAFAPATDTLNAAQANALPDADDAPGLHERLFG